MAKKLLLPLIEAIYSNYPRKIGRTLGLKRALTQCKTEAMVLDLEKAVKNYKAYVERECKEPQYILHFSTFMSQWKDWLDPEAGSVMTAPGPDLKGIGFEP